MPRARRTQTKTQQTAKTTSSSRTKPTGTRAKTSSSRATPSSAPAQRASTAEFKCPECGKTFKRAAALGAHRSRVHGVAGTSRSARTTTASRRQRRTTPTATAPRTRAAATTPRTRRRSSDGTRARLNRDTLLQALFPNGVPAREAIIREANNWLDHAERLARMK
jgi:hypothetical protein